MNKFISLPLSTLFLGLTGLAGAHEFAGLPHPHPHTGVSATPEGAIAMVVIAGALTAATLVLLLSKSGRFDARTRRRRIQIRQD